MPKVKQDKLDCNKCGQPRNYIIKSGKRAGKMHTYCTKCLVAQGADWAVRNKDKALENQRRYWRNNPEKKMRAMLVRYGVDEKWYEATLAEQGGVCAICKQPETWKGKRLDGAIYRLSVDHHHDSTKVRGLLCNSCNHRLGVLEAKEWFESAIAYLNKHHP
jgi:hypothetical protein